MTTDGSDIGSYASQFVGTPYVWGGNSLTNGVDCSGLVVQVFKHYGINLPRTTYDMIGEGKAVGMKGLRPGDLVFFDFGARPGPDHVGIYLGNGKMIHAPRPGKKVEIADITKGYFMDAFAGGRRIDGVHAVGGNENDYADAPPMSKEELASSYGWSYAFLNSNSELKKLFAKAVDDNWTAEKFQAELRDTKWWKTTADSRRQAQLAKKTDPATWNAQLDATKIQLKQIAAEIGAAIPEDKFNKIAANVIESGMDENQIRYAIGQYVDFTKKGTLKGEAAMHEYTMKQYAYNMGVSLSDETIKNQAQRVIKKVATTQDYEDEVRQSAISMYPAYEEQIKAGQTVRDIASPYIQMMASELQIPNDGIDVMDPQIKKAMNGLDAKGKPGGVSLYDFQQQVRSDPRWKATDGAKDGVMSAGLKVLKDMGLVGTAE